MPVTLVLPRELTIYNAAELRPSWLAWLAQDGSDVDAAAVEEVDGAGLQLLIALSHSLSREQRQLRLIDASPMLRAACRSLGLTALLAAPDTEGDAP